MRSPVTRPRRLAVGSALPSTTSAVSEEESHPPPTPNAPHPPLASSSQNTPAQGTGCKESTRTHVVSFLYKVLSMEPEDGMSSALVGLG